MKMLCYFILTIAFLMVYQNNSVCSLIIVGIGLGIFLFRKTRKLPSKHSNSWNFLSRKRIQSNGELLETIKLLMFQKMLESLNLSSKAQENEFLSNKKEKRSAKVENIKKEVLSLLESE